MQDIEATGIPNKEKQLDKTLTPLTDQIGWQSYRPLSMPGYRYVQDGIFHNYYPETSTTYSPIKMEFPRDWVVWGFGANLSADFTLNDLKQLVISRAIQGTITEEGDVENRNKYVSLEVAALGEKEATVNAVKWWKNFTKYNCTVHKDTDLRTVSINMTPSADKTTMVWNVDNKTILINKDGKPTEAFMVLAFMEATNATHIIADQDDELFFSSLQLGSHFHGFNPIRDSEFSGFNKYFNESETYKLEKAYNKFAAEVLNGSPWLVENVIDTLISLEQKLKNKEITDTSVDSELRCLIGQYVWYHNDAIESLSFEKLCAYIESLSEYVDNYIVDKDALITASYTLRQALSNLGFFVV